MDAAIRAVKQDGWRDHDTKRHMVWLAIKKEMGGDAMEADCILELAKKQADY